jgi:hypothetical protein
MTVSLDRLIAARNTVAEAVAGPGGDVYLPIFERLEAEIEARERRQSAVERARQLTKGRKRAAA